MQTILVVAAAPFELKWIQPRHGLRFVKAAGGMGPRQAAAAMDAAMDKGKGDFSAVLSSGLCGALDPNLRVGDVFVADSINGQRVRVPVKSSPAALGPLASVDRIIGTAAERRTMFSTGYRAVEMEAAIVAERAGNLGLPFYCIRAVSDTAAEEFTVDLNAARDQSGSLRIARILAQAARRPVIVVPELLRLRRNAVSAAKALGAFIATCDF